MMRDPYGGKYNTDLEDYYAKVLAECDGTDCPNPDAHAAPDPRESKG